MEMQSSNNALIEQLTTTLGVKPKFVECNEQAYIIALDLSQSNITQLPETLRELTHLQRLNLSNNQLTQISPEELIYFTNLEYLDLHKNQLTSIPAELAQLPHLQHLDLHSNQLTSIPAKLAQLSHLQHLDLYENQLTYVSPELGQLTQLQDLDLSANQLTQIPPELGQLTNLQNLHLHKNQLTQIPPELGRLTNLQYMSLSKNPDLLTPPPEVIAQGTQAVLSFLQDLSREYISRYEAKLMLVGEAGMGKSSLLRDLHGHAFDASLERTHGIEIDMLTLPHPTLPNQSLMLNSWDFGDQGQYHAICQCFLTKQTVYLVIWNARLGEEQGKLDYWLHTISMLAPNAPILLVATHSEEQKFHLNVAQYRAEYPQIVEIMQVSSKTGAGIDELKQAVAKHATTLPIMGQPWQPAWIEVEQELVASPEHSISRSTYIDCAMAKGIHTTIAQGILGSYLHELGRILYFRNDHPSPQDRIILKPNWLAKAISLLLADKGIQDRSGIFVHSDLDRIWAIDEHEQPYDPASRALFLRLMERLNLCYQIKLRHEIYYFIAQLLPSLPPLSLPNWTEKELKVGKVHVEVAYHLNTVPSDIINWFIVHTYQYTCSMHWHDGVVLFYQDHFARIELFSKRKELHLEVWGTEPYTFFVLLKETMDLNLARFEGLHIRQEVPCICHRYTGEVLPCSEVYRYQQDLVRRLNQGVETIQCRESFSTIAIRELLYGHHVNRDQEATPNQQQEIIQQLHDIADKQENLRLEVLAEQKNILKRLSIITGQQNRKSSTQQQQHEVPLLASKLPGPVQQGWNWYKRHQPRKKSKRFSKFGCGIKLGCLLLIGAFFACIIINALISGNSLPSSTSATPNAISATPNVTSNATPNATPSNPVPKQHTKLTLSYQYSRLSIADNSSNFLNYRN
jgi:internalin A